MSATELLAGEHERRYAAGVRNELYGVDNRGDWISLRGSPEATTLLDGMRLPLTGYYGIVRTEPYAYERIEVLRGPSSIIAGQNDYGIYSVAFFRPEDGHGAGGIGHRTLAMLSATGVYVWWKKRAARQRAIAQLRQPIMGQTV